MNTARPRATVARWLRFAVVGVVMVGLNLALLCLLVQRWHWPYLTACTLSFFVLNFVGYVVNKLFTFELEARLQGAELLRYYAVMAASLAANLALMALLVGGLGGPVLMSSVVVSLVLAAANYAGHTRLTFWRPAPRSPEPLRILQVSAFFSAHGGGIEAVAGQLAARLARHGVCVHWFAGGTAQERPACEAASGLRIEQARSIDFMERRLGLPAPIWSPASVCSLWRAVRNADLVHAHDYLYMPTLLAALMAGLQGKPLVLTQHVGEIAFRSAFAHALLRVLNRTLGALVLGSASQVVFVGRPVQRYFEGFVRFRRPPLLLPNGVDHERYRPTDRTAGANPLRVLFVGRFVEKKGLLLLQSCLDLSGIEWTFVGWGPLAPVENKSRANVRVLGRLAAPAIVVHYQQADLLVLPSTGEGFPLVLQEALACGTPVLVSREVAEAFPSIDARCVFDVELRLPQAQAAAALRQRLESLTADPAALGMARPRAAALAGQWSWEACVAAYLSIYRDRAGVTAVT